MKTDSIASPILLNEICNYLNSVAKGMYISAAFSNSKNEFILQFHYKKEQLSLEVYMDNIVSFVFFPESAGFGKSSQHLFPEIENLLFLQAYAMREDRGFIIELEKDYAVLVKLFGRNANVILFFKDQVKEVFRTQFKKDADLLKSDFNIIETNLLPQKYVINESDGRISLALANTSDTLSLSAIPAVNEYAKKYFYHKNFLQQKNKLVQELLKSKQHLQASIEKLTEKTLANASKNYKQMADLILAHIHTITEGTEEVEVLDFYNDNNKIIIKLKKGISPQKYAEVLYRKAKNQDIEKLKMAENLEGLKKKLDLLDQKLTALEQVSNSKALKAFLPSKDSTPQVVIPFRAIQFQDYTIYIGKNAASNDELLHFAGKEDTWLHARGVSGSHVVIKKKSKLPIPKEVITRAAEIAAWYSKAKNSSLVPVIFTTRKYVRKPKGAAPGAVICEREEVLMVAPKEI